jgi:hypothetical protein
MHPGYRPNEYSDMTPEQKAMSRRLVVISNWLGWGGLALIFVGAPLAGFAGNSAAGAGVTAGIGGLAAIAGAIIGQIGRGMQGRVV